MSDEFDPGEATRTIVELDQQVREYFGYQERWGYLPLDDMTTEKWALAGFGHKVVWCDGEHDLADCITNNSEDYYEAQVIDAPIEKGGYALIGVDTECDGNRFLMLFRLSNKVELDEETQEYL